MFRLVVRDSIDVKGANRLYAAGADDGIPESGPQGHSVGFGRQAPTFQDAVLSAIGEVESAQFEVLWVEPDEVVAAADAERAPRSRRSVSSLVSGERGHEGWPAPVTDEVHGPLWRSRDIPGWSESLGGSQTVDRGAAAFLTAVNEVLAARRALQQVDRKTRQRLCRQLVG